MAKRNAVGRITHLGMARRATRGQRRPRTIGTSIGRLNLSRFYWTYASPVPPRATTLVRQRAYTNVRASSCDGPVADSPPPPAIEPCAFPAASRARLSLALCLPASARAQRSDSLFVPFTMEHRAADSSSLDLSFLLDAPAGKHGFARVRDGHLVRGDGARLRLWGVHLTDWSRGSVLLPPKEDAPMWASTLARYGINCVRLHFVDLDAPRGIIAAGSDSRHFDAQQLDRLDFLVAELKKRGIYIDLNLNVGRSYRAGDSVPDFDRIRWAKGMTLYDPRLIALQKEYARMLLTHVNPYTGLAYRDEPAMAIVEILNENAVWVGFTATPFYDAELTTLYNEWLARNLSAAELGEAARDHRRRGRRAGAEAQGTRSRRGAEGAVLRRVAVHRRRRDAVLHRDGELPARLARRARADHRDGRPRALELELSDADVAVEARHRRRARVLAASGLAAAGEHADGERSAPLDRRAALAHRGGGEAVHGERVQSPVPQRVGGGGDSDRRGVRRVPGLGRDHGLHLRAEARPEPGSRTSAIRSTSRSIPCA